MRPFLLRPLRLLLVVSGLTSLAPALAALGDPARLLAWRAAPQATDQAVQGFAQFKFGDSLYTVRSRLERSFPNSTHAFERGFGRVSLRAYQGITLNGQQVRALFTFVNDKLAQVTLELPSGKEADREKLSAYLERHFGTPSLREAQPVEQQFGRMPTTTYAGGSVVVEGDSLFTENYLAVHFENRAVMDEVLARQAQSLSPDMLMQLIEQGGWKTLPHESYAHLDDFVRALAVGDSLEHIALLSEHPTQERLWAGSFFYAEYIMATHDEARGQKVLQITGTELMNPLSLFWVGRLNYTQGAYGKTPQEKKKAQEGYLQMMNAYNLVGVFENSIPNLGKLLADQHVAMLSGLANGYGDMSAAERQKVDASWAAFWKKFVATYSAPPKQ